MTATTTAPTVPEITGIDARRLWNLFNLPDSDYAAHARRKLAKWDDPTLIAFRDLLLQGRETAVPIIETTPVFASLMQQVQIAKPDHETVTKQRQAAKLQRNKPCPCGSGQKYKDCHLDEVRRNPAAALFLQATGLDPVMVTEDFCPGTGEFPKRPQHTCDYGKKQRSNDKDAGGAAITIRATGAKAVTVMVSPMITPKWRDNENRPGCRGCYHDRVVRLSKQILTEGYKRDGLEWGTLPTEKEYKRFADNTRQRRKRHSIDGAYCAYRQEDGSYVVVAELNLISGQTAVMPMDKGEVYRLVYGWANTPDDKRISSSLGWGGNWQGTKGDGRVKQARREGQDPGKVLQLWTTTSVKDVAKALGVETEENNTFTVVGLPEHIWKGNGGEKDKAGNELVNGRFDGLSGLQNIFERKTNRQGLEAFLEFIGVDVTHNGQDTTPKDSLCLMRDKSQQIEPAEVVLLPDQGVFEAVFGGGA